MDRRGGRGERTRNEEDEEEGHGRGNDRIPVLLFLKELRASRRTPGASRNFRSFPEANHIPSLAFHVTSPRLALKEETKSARERERETERAREEHARTARRKNRFIQFLLLFLLFSFISHRVRLLNLKST